MEPDLDDPHWKAIIYELGGWEMIDRALMRMKAEQREADLIAQYIQTEKAPAHD